MQLNLILRDKPYLGLYFHWYEEQKSHCDTLVSIYENVRYQSGISFLKADRAEIDIINKKTKIFMENPNKKVQINNLSKNGNN